MTDEDIPPFLDRRPNGRARAFWLCHDAAPGHVNAWEHAEKNYLKYLDKAAILDEKEGLLPCCKDYSKPKLKPVRQRSR